LSRFRYLLFLIVDVIVTYWFHCPIIEFIVFAIWFVLFVYRYVHLVLYATLKKIFSMDLVVEY